MKLRPLGVAKEIIEATGLTITYTYDDLIFIEHNPFLIQFDDENPKNLKLFFNIDCEAGTVEQLEKQLTGAAFQRQFSITRTGQYELSQKPGSEEIEITFHES